MIVVSDSTPLITLMKAGKLQILEALFSEVFIPEAVFSEVTNNPRYRDEASLVMGSEFIHVVHVEDAERVSFLRRVTGLDLGESEAIVYADQARADLILMDEVAGRKVAQKMGIPMTGSIGILVRSCQAGLMTIGEAEEAFERIRHSGRHISARLLEYALSIIRNTA